MSIFFYKTSLLRRNVFVCIGTSKRAPCKVNQTRIPVGKKVHVFITSVTSPDDFFCQLTETSAELDDLMNEMEEHYRPLGEQEEACTNPQVVL
jgi:hypothetical protein